jgi:hypothetical protein
MSFVGHMTMDARQAGELVAHGEQVLKRPKRNRGKGKAPIDRESAHVAFEKSHSRLHVWRFSLQTTAAHMQHLRRSVESDDLYSCSRGRNQHPARAAADLQNRSATRSGSVHIEGDVSTFAIRRDEIVILRYCRVFVACQRRMPRSVAVSQKGSFYQGQSPWLVRIAQAAGSRKPSRESSVFTSLG